MLHRREHQHNNLNLQSIIGSLLLLHFLCCSVYGDHAMNKIVGKDSRGYDFFGYALAIDNGSIIVGAKKHDVYGGDSGAAYIFENSGDNSWSQVAEIYPSDGAARDKFGQSVDIYNDYAVISAFGDDGYRGSAYIYEKSPANNQWTQKQKLRGSDTASRDEFGYDVAIYNDIVVVGAWKDSDSVMGEKAGSAYIFKRGSDGRWTQFAKLTASDGSQKDRFGRSVDIYDGYIIIGAYGNDETVTRAGAAYIFERDTSGNYVEAVKLLASEGTKNDWFGYHVAIHNTYTVVSSYRDNEMGRGSGSVYVFERKSDGQWLEVVKLTPSDGYIIDHFGTAVGLYEDVIVVGSVNDDDKGWSSGSGYVYKRDLSGNWVFKTKVLAKDGFWFDRFGIAVDIYDDYMVFGAYNEDTKGQDSGSAYIIKNYDSCNDLWNQSDDQQSLKRKKEQYLVDYVWTVCDFSGYP